MIKCFFLLRLVSTICLLVVIISLISLIACIDGEKQTIETTLQSSPELSTQAITTHMSAWQEKVSSIVWVAYSPTNTNPDKGIEASPESIREDLIVLHQAGFTGLVTYSSSGVLGHEFPAIAQSLGFQGLIMGVWDPSNQEEIILAKAAAELPIVLGFCIGNEGLQKRYNMSVLSTAIQDLGQSTNKPVTTTEEIDDYFDEDLLNLGDWVFPNAHPYFHNQFEPDAAVRWTEGAYEDCERRTERFVMFKEVGLPTAGDLEASLSETNQEKYYQELAKTDVRFVYFEAFDQTWKTHLPVEPHWGIFNSERTPKLLGLQLMGKEPGFEQESQSKPESESKPEPELDSTPEPESETEPESIFYIYRDANWPDNHYAPTGYMGDTGDIHINVAYQDNPHSEKTCIRVIYDAKGQGPNECEYRPPCKWAGAYWLEPPNNWGENEFWKGKGYDLAGYKRLVFWARADEECTIKFQVGGIDKPFGDSLTYPRSTHANLSKDWQEFEIILEGENLSYIIGGFAWVTNWDTNPNGVTFYLDDIRFEKK